MSPERQYADYERKDGLFLTQREWDDLATICEHWLEHDGCEGRISALALRISAAAQIDGFERED